LDKKEVRGSVSNDDSIIKIYEEFSGFMNCPKCKLGILWGVRNIKTDQILDEVDTCSSCGLKVRYLNIKNNKIRKRRIVPKRQLKGLLSIQ